MVDWAEGPPRVVHVLWRSAINMRDWSPDSRGAKRLSTGWAQCTARHGTRADKRADTDWGVGLGVCVGPLRLIPVCGGWSVCDPKLTCN